jgi:hypothetical protein
MKLSASVFGVSEFALRLPALLGHLLYLIASFLLVRPFTRPMARICGFLILNTNLHILDFFSVGRGYSLGLAFMLLSLYYLTKSWHAITAKDEFLASLFALLTALCHIAFLDVYLSLLVVRLGLTLLRRNDSGNNRVTENRFWRLFSENRNLIFNTIILAVILVKPLIKLKTGKEFYFGGSTGLWHDTVETLIQGSLYEETCSLAFIAALKIAIALSLISSALLFIYKAIRKNLRPQEATPLILLAILFVCGLGITMQHYLFGAPFLKERAALFLVPLFYLVFIYFLDSLRRGQLSSIKRISTAALLLTALVLSFHAVRYANLTHTLTYVLDANTKDMISDLTALHNAHMDSYPKIRLGINWFFEPAVNFYRVTRGLTWLNEVDRGGLNRDFDYYFYMPEDEPVLKEKNILRIKEYPLTHTALAKNKAMHPIPTSLGTLR